ncbi:MAG: hypothetical protein RIB46_02180 [Pseudomonadales bacterium]
MSLTRAERARHMRDYVDLQLRFAARLAEAGGLDPAEALLRYTNLHRRLALGPPDVHGPHPAWFDFAGRLLTLPDHDARVACAVAAWAAAGAEPPLPNQQRFGAFGCNPPDADGLVRIHFSPDDGDDVSPLAAGKVARRRAELAALTRHVAGWQPRARAIRGTSWLYHLDAYRRLFPSAYAQSATLHGPGLSFAGNANWGQFVTFRGEFKAEAGARMRANLQRLDPGRPWLAFPLPALTVQAPVDVFLGEFEAV